MATRKSRASELEVPPAVPPFYVAVQDILIGDGTTGTMPVPAFRAGDRVPVDLVDTNGWADQVELPDGYKQADPEVEPVAAEPEAAEDGGGEQADEISSAPADDNADLGAEGVTDASTRDAS
jgi:hypothetical protein